MRSKTYSELRLILGDQLNHRHSWFSQVDSSVLYVMMEIRPESEYVRHHIQKITGFFTAMRHFSKWLKGEGHEVAYFRINDSDNRHSFDENIEQLVRAHGLPAGRLMEPDEYRLDVQLSEIFTKRFKHWAKESAEHFYTSRHELRDQFRDRKTYRMESFYRSMRKKCNVLVDDAGQPEAGKWNFDQDNRKPLPEGHPLPDPLMDPVDVSEIYDDILQAGLPSIGAMDPKSFHWPVTREAALAVHQAFIRDRLPYFGAYQDAMTVRSWQLFHSMLSFSLNLKLIGPDELVREVENAWRQNPAAVRIEQAEGYIRQILGWREYMRGIYWAQMPGYETLNYFGHQRKLPEFYWTGRTRMNCMKYALDQSIEHAYAHHIQRLMVTGNFALLAGIDPDEVDRWYLGIYVDAVQWVEITNTRGMSQYADGGIVGTKPYVSSASYINRMSDYCSACHYDKKQRTGEGACPFNSLYWHFYARNRPLLEKNPRIGMMYRTWDRMSPGQQKSLLSRAGQYLEEIESL